MLKKLLLLALSATLLAGCGSQPGESTLTPTSEPTATSQPAGENENAKALKQAGGDVLKFAAEDQNSQSLRALDPLDSNDKIIYLSLPGTLLYMSGALYDVDGVDIENHVFEFGGDYEFKFGDGEWTTQNIIFAIKANVDKENGKIYLNAKQTISMNGTLINTGDVFIEVDFDFEQNKTGNFELFMDQVDQYAYVKVENNEAWIRKYNTALTPEEAADLDGRFAALKTSFAAEYAEKVSSTEANNRACMEKFVLTQLYCNEIIHQDLPVRIKE